MEGEHHSSRPIDLSSKDVVLEALRAAGNAVEGDVGGSSESLWELVSGDNLASSYFLKSLSISLGVEIPSRVLRCKKFEEVVGLLNKVTAGAGVDSQSKLPVRTFGIKQRTPRVAIVSVSCRLPGGVRTLGDLWADVLILGRDVITPIPISRWDADVLYDPEGSKGTVYVKEGGFLEDADAFDNNFFDISDHEATQMDPQQRLLLEAAFEARVPLTKGRLNPPDETGVFIGSSCVDWFLVHAKLPSRDGPSCFVADLQHAMLANRISYCMNLEGASMTIDTATSSGIVAFCTAVSHIESNRMLCALAGSSQLIIAPEVTVALCNLGMLSRTGRCRPFDEASDGFIRSEGVIVFSLVREDYVSEFVDTSAVQPLAFVRGHAVVHSGRAFSTTAPSESAERRVMEGALAKAKMTPDEVDYIEAHGTGTRMGDAVEMQSLAAVFGESHEYARPLLVGSIKGNIGHCEGSSGGAGICKAILVLINRCVPATVHFNRLSSLIDRTPRYFFIPRAATQVPIADRSLVVGVSSFGVGGCNGHVILEGPKTNSHDFKTQLNDKCAWKRNRFPWSHLIDIPGHNNEVGSPIEMGIPASARASSSFSFEDTALSIVDSFLDESIDESVPVPSMDTRILRNGSQTKMTGSRSGSLQDLSLTTGNCVKGVPVEEPAKHIAASFHSEDAGSTHLGGSSPHGYTNTVPSAVQCGRSEALSTSMPSISRQKIRAAVDESLRLALNRNEAIEETTPFVEAGVDSMTSIGIRESLSKKLEIQLPATLLYDHPCIAELVPRLEQLLCEDRGVSTNQAIHPGLWHATDEKDVAVTALSCRLPPGSYCESEFWEGLKAGQDCIQHIPLSRFDPWKYRTSGASPSEKLYVSDAGTFPDMCLFDNALFNISPAEAQLMDPHQRILLEVCHETIAPALDDRSLVDLAIIVGCCNNDWVRETCTSAQEAKSLSGTGSAASIVSNRLSYVFNLHGPILQSSYAKHRRKVQDLRRISKWLRSQ
ncbi:soraphen polyketide synthase related protein [Cyclospora cayetanensis]|uniref:Soraphen polyketide synthase related protein n=1 Tax=Cyclospora cayetanensis TaxID=88456 RepID=A0A1D3D7U7_9EIME|nr:soraphen polyketide synthase related protein [Cyclospora cayetanensis]